MEPDLSPAELEAAAASALSASDILTDVIISRLIRQVDASGTTFRANVSGWVDGLAAARSSFRASLGRLCAYRSQWLDKELEELDGVEKLLAAAARLCDSEGLNCVIVDASVSPLLVLTTACDTLPRHSCVLSMIADGRQVVASLLHSRARAMPTGDLNCCTFRSLWPRWCFSVYFHVISFTFIIFCARH